MTACTHAETYNHISVPTQTLTKVRRASNYITGQIKWDTVRHAWIVLEAGHGLKKHIGLTGTTKNFETQA